MKNHGFVFYILGGLCSGALFGALSRLDAWALQSVLPGTTAFIIWSMYLPLGIILGLFAYLVSRLTRAGGLTVLFMGPGFAYAILLSWIMGGWGRGRGGEALSVVLPLALLVISGTLLRSTARSGEARTPDTLSLALGSILTSTGVILVSSRLAWLLLDVRQGLDVRGPALGVSSVLLAVLAIGITLTALSAHLRARAPRAGALLAILLSAGAVLGIPLCPEEIGLSFSSKQSAVEVEPRPAGRGQPDIVLLSLDTVRRDRLSVYDRRLRTTPRLEEFAREALVYENAISTSPWTLPSHASLFTGLFPSEHGAIRTGGPLRGHPLSPGDTLLAEELKKAGYATAGFVANWAYLNSRFGFDRGFNRYMDHLPPTLADPLSCFALFRFPGRHRDFSERFGLNVVRLGPEINRAALAWLDDFLGESAGRGGDRPPFFLFLNYMEAHWVNYLPFRDGGRFLRDHVLRDQSFGERRDESIRQARPPEADVYEAMLRWYDDEVRFLDEALGGLFQSLRERDLFENSLIVVWSDHGEMLGEHGSYGHETELYDELLRVPLLVKLPGGAGGVGDPVSGRVASYVQSTDLGRFIREVGRGNPQWEAIGGDPVGGVRPQAEVPESGREAAWRPLASAELYICQRIAERYPERYARDLKALYCRTDEGKTYKLISGSNGQSSLYSAEDDLAEMEDLATREPEVLAKADSLLRDWEAGLRPPPPLQPETHGGRLRSLLHSLGYTD